MTGVRRNTTLHSVILWTHRWLGLASSAVLAIVGVTGVFLVWRNRPFWEQNEWLAYAAHVAQRLHETLALGSFGSMVVVSVTGIAILIEIGGLILWWRRKIAWMRTGRGWWRTCFDLHHVVGVICLPLMLLLAVTGFVMGVLDINEYNRLWRFMANLHRGQYPFPIDVLYAAASIGFLVQGVTGLIVWWRPGAKDSNSANVQGLKSL